MTLSLLQYLFALCAIFAIVRTALKARARAIPLVWAFAWGALWCLLGVIALLPETTTFLASSLGIGRGADLVVYLSIGILYWVAFRLVLKVESLEQQITKIVRADALRDVQDHV